MSNYYEQAYSYLRTILNPAIKGKNTEAILRSLATGAAYYIKQIDAIRDNIYITTASDRYLDERLASYGLTRDPKVGIFDDTFRYIGISVINRKQVRDLVMELLRVMFGDDVTQATLISGLPEPYNLSNNDDLLVSLDGNNTKIKLIFKASQFNDINNATAQEVADAITKEFKRLGQNGKAYVFESDTGRYVVISSNTTGPSSSITVRGGKAQNVLLFEKLRPTTAGASTTWQIVPQPNGNVRYFWVGGPNPVIGKVKKGDYVNIYSSSFHVNNRGSFDVIDVQSGGPGTAFFEIYNPIGVAETQSQGTNNAILFFYPKKADITHKFRFAALFQEKLNLIEIFIPVSTKVVRRFRKGAAHLHEPILMTTTIIPGKNQIVQIEVPSPSLIVDGSYFLISGKMTGNQYYVYFDKTGNNLNDPMATPHPIRVDISNLTTASEVGFELAKALNNIDLVSYPAYSSIVLVHQTKIGVISSPTNINVPNLNITIYQAGVDEVITTTSTPNPLEAYPDQYGPYVYDIKQQYTFGKGTTTLTQPINVGDAGFIYGVDFSQFQNKQNGYIVINQGTVNEEGPIPYIAIPNTNLMQISPTYFWQKKHPINSIIREVYYIGAPRIDQIATHYPFYLTDIVAGRIYCQEIIKSILAIGVKVIFHILYPYDEGLGKWGTEYSEKIKIWGDD